jgi:hypothetical protein
MNALNMLVIPAHNREKVVNGLRDSLQSWGDNWFVDTIEMEFFFNDELFALREVLKGEDVYEINGNFMLINGEVESFRHVLCQILKLESSLFGSSNQALFDELKAKIVDSLLNTLGANFFNSSPVKCNKKSIQENIVVIIFPGKKEEIRISFEISVKPEKSTNSQLISRIEASKEKVISLTAQLSSVKLPLEKVLTLNVGDIVLTEHKLDDSIVLTLDKKQLELNAYLSKRGPNKTILITE